MPVIEGSIGLLQNAGAPVAGTDEVQTITIGGTPTAGTFTLTFEGFTTAAITWSNVNATLIAAIDSALELLPNVGSSGVVMAVGTMTAGIVGAVGNNGIGVAGVNWRSQIMECKAFESTIGDSASAIACIDFFIELQLPPAA